MYAPAKTIILLLSFTCIILQANAQQAAFNESRPAAFRQMRDSSGCSTAALQKLISLPAGSAVSLALAPGILLKGEVVSNIQKYSNLKTVIIRCTEWNNSLFSLSEVTEDGAISYSGRSINAGLLDGFELVKVNQHYILKKIQVDDFLMD